MPTPIEGSGAANARPGHAAVITLAIFCTFHFGVREELLVNLVQCGDAAANGTKKESR